MFLAFFILFSFIFAFWENITFQSDFEEFKNLPMSIYTSFNQQLGGQWATSTVFKPYMFNRGCPGSIEGKTNDRWGTPK